MTREQACKLLNVAPAAELPAIRAQYRKFASRYHPDRFHTPEEREAATQHFQEIAEAFALLRSEAREKKRHAPTPAATPMHAATWTHAPHNTESTPIWWDHVDPQPIRSPATASAPRWGNPAAARAELGRAIPAAADGFAAVLLVPVLLPSIVARALARGLVAVLGDGLGLPESLANFVGLLAGHVIPGYLGLAVGRALVLSPQDRALAAILYGLWWVVSGGLAFAMDRVA